MEIKSIIFDLVDVTNLSTPDAGHMRKLVLTFADQDHFTHFQKILGLIRKVKYPGNLNDWKGIGKENGRK